MKKTVQTMMQHAVLLPVLVLGFAVAVPATALLGDTPVYAQDATDAVQEGLTAAGGDDQSNTDLKKVFQTIVNTLLFIAGAVAVIMIILGGFRYMTSNGDQADVKAAKDTILYSVVGLVVAIISFALVQFVIGIF